MRSMVHIHPLSIGDILPTLAMLGVKIVGSAECDDGAVALKIEGDTVPEARQVDCTVTRRVIDGTATLEMTFGVVHP